MTEGFVGRIPVRNVWFLMLYASDLFRVNNDLRRVDIERGSDEIPNLVAEVLAHSVESRLHKNLNYGYVEQNAVETRVRGRIDFLTTESRNLLASGQVACRYQRLSIDTPRNRYVKAALESLSRLVSRPLLSHRCRKLAGTLQQQGVLGGKPSEAEMTRERFGRHDQEDQSMVAAAKLAFNLSLPNELSGKHALPNPEKELVWMRKLFEKAVGGFYDVTLRDLGWTVKCGGHLSWQIDRQTAGINALLPGMRTDIVLTHIEQARKIVIDTKFNEIVTKGWFKDKTLRSQYLYQIYTYLRSQAGAGNKLDDSACGLLLHPAVSSFVSETVVIQGHPIKFATVDLAMGMEEIKLQLLDAVKF